MGLSRKISNMRIPYEATLRMTDLLKSLWGSFVFKLTNIYIQINIKKYEVTLQNKQSALIQQLDKNIKNDPIMINEDPSFKIGGSGQDR